MITLIAIIGGSLTIALALYSISNAISSSANAIKELAHQVHVHAEVMTEIKHQGIGCDDKQTPVYEYRAV